MRKILVLTAVCLLLATALVSTADASTGAGPKSADTSRCSGIHVSDPADARVLSVTTSSSPAGDETFSATALTPAQTVTDVPASCDVTVTLTHPGVHDRVTVQARLPREPKGWNGRFQAVGGGGYQAGDSGAGLANGVKSGYAAATTDAGVSSGGMAATDVSAWALRSDGTVNSGLLRNFASRSVHDLAVVGKNVTTAYYGNAVRYSYWNGCSTGGRQGYVEAQQHPRDFQGILADAPAINWDRFAVATLWSQAVFNEEHTHPSVCELEAFNSAATKACDAIDGVTDGIIDNPQECHWNPRRLIGTKVVCEGQTLTITAADARVVRKIWAGPTTPEGRKLWYGPNKGASFAYLADSTQPFVIADQWARYFVARDPQLDTNKLTYRTFDALFHESERRYNHVIGADDPNLSAFAAAGGKLLSWQGQSDQLVPTQGTVDYRERVDAAMGGTHKVDSFYRLFLLPGVAHCGLGNGPQPTDALGQLTNWVEHGTAPATLTTSATRTDGTTATRKVCRFPEITQYDATGDPNRASSYHCSG